MKPQARQWRSLEEYANTPEFRERIKAEFPSEASLPRDPVSRRDLLKALTVSLGFGSLAACVKGPADKIVPYVRQPEEITPGKPLFYATAMTLGGYAKGVLVESHEGRPTKIEGNPLHPASLGATDAFAQASVLTLWDPDRAQVVARGGQIDSWTSFSGALAAALEEQQIKKGAGLRLLTETITSPTLADQIAQFLQLFPQAKWHQYEPVSGDAAREGMRLAFGEIVNPIYHFERANVILSLDADFLGCGPGSVRYNRDFAARRNPDGPAGMNRLYMVEGSPSITGSMADHRIRRRTGGVEEFARQVAAALENGGASGDKELAAIAKDLLAHRGASLVIAGDSQPAAVHALACALNQRLGNTGGTVVYTTPVEAAPVNQTQSLHELIDAMNSGAVDTLVILGGNPVFTAPRDFGFAQAMSKVKLRIHSGLYQDETSSFCHWHLPETHYLEAWSDARAFDGTVTIMQPLIAPLYPAKSAHEILSALLGKADTTSHDSVRGYWGRARKQENFDLDWEQWLHDGVVPNTALPEKSVTVKTAIPASQSGSGAEGIEISFRPDPTIWDGRFANNGWLEELPKPLTRLTWENAVMISPATAKKLKLENEDQVELGWKGVSVFGPVWVFPGHADDSVTVHFGYGRRRAGRWGTGIGFDAFALRTSAMPWSGVGATLRRTGVRQPLACTQGHFNMEGRELVNVGTAGEVKNAPPPELSLYPGFQYQGHAWGMAIDLNACTGCNACVIACQAENNIPVVGKGEVLRQREMHWIRIDRYFEGSPENPRIYNQPVLCMHCENAPCEIVCPTGATVHSGEGLNQMVYNRCVGTRYCSNNCPYKVRRFNFFQFADWNTPSLKGQRNPEVTVRSRGVMEKCTYCVQRIEAAKILAEKEDRPVRDGEIVTACQGACPARAIVFGDINDKNSAVSKLKASKRNYALLAELNTRPRTTYLSRLLNPNPELNAEDRHAG